ncbi:MAG: hypothetical protein ACRDZQ_09965, partial [Acidimicrobiales bacterium]
MTPADRLAMVLRRLRRRALLDSGLVWGLRGTGAAATVAVAVLVWSRLRPEPHAALALAAAVLAAALVALAGWARTRPDLTRVARVADARLGLDERLATALAFASDPGELPARLLDDAGARSADLPPGRAFPLRRHRRLGLVAAAAVVVAAGLALS